MEITRPIQYDDMHQIAFQLKGPHFKELLNVTNDTIVFDGYFRYEPDMFREEHPIHRLLYFQNHVYYVAFVEKKVGKDTSCYWYDEEVGGNICLTPTEFLEIRYRVLEKDPTHERLGELVDIIEKQEHTLRHENEAFYIARQKREWDNYHA